MEVKVPDLTRKVLGYREFGIATMRWDPPGRCEPRLASMGVRHLWEPGVNEAVCLARNEGLPPEYRGPAHDAPAHTCTCGLYAYHPAYRRHIGATGELAAIVLAWGRMEVHSLGFRAQFMEVALLLHRSPVIGAKLDVAVEELAERYGVRIIPERALGPEDEVFSRGEVLPKSLVPDHEDVRLGGLQYGGARVPARWTPAKPRMHWSVKGAIGLNAGMVGMDAVLASMGNTVSAFALAVNVLCVVGLVAQRRWIVRNWKQRWG